MHSLFEKENTSKLKKKKIFFPVLKWGAILRSASYKISKAKVLRIILTSAYFLFKWKENKGT